MNGDLLRDAIVSAKGLANDVAAELDGVDLAADDKTQVAAALFFVVLDHHVGIIKLVEGRLHAPAMALLRPQWDSFLRGMWYSHVASAEESGEFRGGGKAPKPERIIKALENADIAAPGSLSSTHAQTWDILCDYAHSGSRQVNSHLSGDAVERTCSDSDLAGILKVASYHVLPAAFGVAELAGRMALVQRLFEIGRKHRCL
jgi:hypothetical protein